MPDKPFSTLFEFTEIIGAFPKSNTQAQADASMRNSVLTKPPGALGRLEDIAIWYAGWRGEEAPSIQNPQVIVFAGNHGVAKQGVSAFPAEVTAQMVYNFQAGGAAINQLSKAFGATLNVHALDLENPTADFTVTAAMTEDEIVTALLSGWNSVDPLADLMVTGEMGIGNTTSAAAIASALYGGLGVDWVGRGTGVDDDGLGRKAQVVDLGVAKHSVEGTTPLETLRRLGGRELAAIVGAIARARVERIPVILDGFICTAAAAVLEATEAGALDHCIAGHVSAEQAHAKLLENLNKEPILSLGLRLGEGSGAALAIGVLKGALACHSGMATFAEAGVSEG